MKFYRYVLSIPPLDWECCFLSIEEYKQSFANKYNQNIEYYKRVIGDCQQHLVDIDNLAAVTYKDLCASVHSAELRCPAMIFSMPSGDHRGSALFCIMYKLEEDGDTFIYSPVPLVHLEQDRAGEIEL
ncbi:hypothetical protein GPJ61_20395 [Brevibacillus formosus]|uniref:hypothetical protein n=1 Tax=Brevibacillus formosus TaxID=54913 RepID=UPI001CA58C08|nr:hypothetical protein [Brevibacillus formosus]MBW5470190.1 hypothetical protein [Brevibacillus formosus]